MEHSKVDVLFENNSIAEIDEIRNKLKNDVETKKDDLKQIVGERYRDLIDASDTIQDMKQKCSDILMSINKLNAFCEQFSCYKSRITASGITAQKASKESHYDNSLPIIFKVILKTPTAIWMSLDTGDVLKAIFFYFHVKHIDDNLDNSKTPKLISDYIHAIDSFRQPLLDRCWDNLQCVSGEDMDENLIALHLNCVLLLENTSIASLYEKFVKKQMSDFKASFDFEVNAEDACYRTSKILFHCLRTSFLVFFDNSGAKSLLIRNMAIINKASFGHTFLMNERTREIPQLITEFRLKSPMQLEDVTPTDINTVIVQFIKEVKGEGNERIFSLLKKISSITNIFDILSKVNAYFLECDRYSQWDEFCDSLLSGNRCDIWKTFLRIPVMQTLKSLFHSKLQNAFSALFEKVKLLKANDVCDFSLSAHIWKGDVSNGSNHLKSRAFGISIILKKFCDEFDSNMEEILSDSQIINNSNFQPKLINEVDKNELRSCFFDVTKALNSKFALEMKKMIEETSDENILSFLSHLCRSLTQCCPHFKTCFGSVNVKTNENWSAAKSELVDVSYSGFEVYFNRVIERLFTFFGSDFDCSIHYFVENFLVWEESTVEETTEDDKKLSSTIRIPSHLSLYLYNFLSSFVEEANAVVAHTVSKKVTVFCLIKISREIANLYSRKVLEIKSSQTLGAIKQTFALQLYFDLLYWKQLLVNTREDTIKREAIPIIQGIATNFETLIDPFDLHVLLPKMQENVVRMNKRSSLLFGLLLPEPSSNIFATLRSKESQNNEKHNVMPFHFMSTPFQLLLVPKCKRLL